MDELLARRLVGALVLVAGALLLAALLPDPDREPPAPPGQRVTFEPDGGVTGNAAGPAAAVPRAAEPVPASPEAADNDLPEPAAPPAAAELDPPGWYVQIGSFGNETNARAVLQRLYDAGQPARLQAVQVGREYWYRVRVGPYGEEAAAREVLARLEKQGWRGGKVVRAG
ncbi:MAG TPA: SPOR domain-containing protein [Candidatus Binatia bacterium]|nr:SPOR domain-containing protein [Candidatus Binatia bacterium]